MDQRVTTLLIGFASINKRRTVIFIASLSRFLSLLFILSLLFWNDTRGYDVTRLDQQNNFFKTQNFSGYLKINSRSHNFLNNANITTALDYKEMRKPLRVEFRKYSLRRLKETSGTPRPSVVDSVDFWSNNSEKETQSEKDVTVNKLFNYDYTKDPYYRWNTAPDECANYAVRFMQEGSHTMIPLVSFPGSGNTWLRYLLEGAAGIFTGSVYYDKTLLRKGTFAFPLSKWQRNQVVLLIRNPFDAIISLRHYHAAGHTGFASPAYFKSHDWFDFAINRSSEWIDINRSWLQEPDIRIHVVFYEVLVGEIQSEMKGLLNFLGVPIDYGRLACLIRYPEGPFRRPKYPKLQQGYKFPLRAYQEVWKGIHEINKFLQRRALPELPIHLYTYIPEVYED